jgi:dihydroxyacetone kinase-like protein
MNETIGADELVRMIHGAAEEIRAAENRLNRLDRDPGDGDHGANMVRAMDAADQAAEGADPDDLQDVLENVGDAMRKENAGPVAKLLGLLFLGAADVAKEHQHLDTDGLAAALVAGLALVNSETDAHAGDRTMMDALIPAITNLRDAADTGLPIPEALAAAADAANDEAEQTADMDAEESIGGGQDPGAVTVALLFRGLADWCE